MWCFDVFEEDGRIVVEGDLPGCGKEDVAVFGEACRLVLTGRRRDTGSPAGRTYFQRERRSAFVSQEIALPRPVDVEEAEATLYEGVLRVRLRPAGPAPRGGLAIPIDAR